MGLNRTWRDRRLVGSLRRTVLERQHRPKTPTAAVGMRVDSQQLLARCWLWALMGGLSLVTGLGDAFQERVYPLLQTHCFRCHGEKRKKGGVDLAHFNEAKSVYRDPKLWEKVLSQLNDRSMPPDEEPTPSAEDVEVITRWIEGALENPPADLVPLDPGSKPVHRLGRIEYNNTLRDLLGVTNRPADRFPSDGGGGGGFENNAETLFLPPLLLERYLATAAEAISQAAPERLYTTRPVWYSSQRLAARDNLRWFARRAFRRPVQDSEVQRLLALYDRTRSSGVPYESALKTAYKAILVSPHFLFRVEIDPPGKAPARISDHELAVRLSYFLWSSMPDEALFRVAEQGQLGNPEVLEQEVRRMLRDPKASALAESFAGQWFGVRNLTTGPQPDRQKHPEYTESLRDALAAEPVAFFNYLVQLDRPLTELIEADYAFVNSELAKHYGLTNPPKGTTLSRVILPVEARQQGRGGLVGMGAVLVQTSYPRRSSPVLRGKWLLEEVLGTPPPPPPPLVKTLSQDDKPRDGLSFRQRLEEHRKNPSCAGCHQRMDPLGFALENFDATGRWRRDIGGELIDSKGTLVSGETVDGPVDLKRALMARRALFLRHITEKMLAYALGRGLEFYDMPMVKHISDSLVRGDARATELILDVVRSYPFQYRRGADTLAASSPSGH
jgi:hypothetical protein